MRSEHELTVRLKQKDFSARTIKKTLDYFRSLDITDDRLFARGWIASRLNKPYGIKRINQELKQKGIPREILEAEVSRAQEHYDEEAAVRALAQKRWRKYAGLPGDKGRKRLYGYLTRRGFHSGPINTVMRELRNDDST